METRRNRGFTRLHCRNARVVTVETNLVLRLNVRRNASSLGELFRIQSERHHVRLQAVFVVAISSAAAAREIGIKSAQRVTGIRVAAFGALIPAIRFDGQGALGRSCSSIPSPRRFSHLFKGRGTGGRPLRHYCRGGGWCVVRTCAQNRYTVRTDCSQAKRHIRAS